MLLRDTDVLDEDFSVWPVVVIAIGVSMTLEALTARRRDNDVEIFGPGS